MRLIGILVGLAAFAWSGVAAAQPGGIVIPAQPVPIIDATINNRPVRLEVDLRMPEALAMSNAARDRLNVRRVPFVGVRIGVDGSNATIAGRIARPRLLFQGQASRAFTGIFPAPVTRRADGVIGPAAIPHDVVTIQLGPELEGARDIVLPLEDPDLWAVYVTMGGERMRVWFNVADQETVFNRTAARIFDASGVIVSSGELAEKHVILGLSTMMQPVTTELTFEGLPLGPTFARTNSPLLGAEEEGAIVVSAGAEELPPSMMLGRAALSRCSSIRGDRRARTLTLRCA